MSARCLAILLGLAATSLAHSEALPLAGPFDSRVRFAIYSPDQVYHLYAFVGYDIRLEFAPEERFVSIDGGDLDALTYSARGSVVSLKPRAEGAEMDLAITTTRHTYYFEYTALTGRPDETTQIVMYVVRFRYSPEADDRNANARTARQIDAALKEASHQRRENRDYWYCGAPSLKPTAASDDGLETRLRFAPRAELPAIFVRNADDTESLVNFTVEGGDLLIHRVATRFIVRRGKLAGCIVNKGFGGGSARLNTHTVSSEVERQAKVPRP